jgi:hypothetical protein
MAVIWVACSAVQTGGGLPMFWGCLLPPSPSGLTALMMEAAVMEYTYIRIHDTTTQKTVIFEG